MQVSGVRTGTAAASCRLQDLARKEGNGPKVGKHASFAMAYAGRLARLGRWGARLRQVPELVPEDKIRKWERGSLGHLHQIRMSETDLVSPSPTHVTNSEHKTLTPVKRQLSTFWSPAACDRNLRSTLLQRLHVFKPSRTIHAPFLHLPHPPPHESRLQPGFGESAMGNVPEKPAQCLVHTGHGVVTDQ